MNVILASTSIYRQAQLKQLAVEFQAVAPLVDEEKLKDPSLGPQKLAESLAKAKAESLKTRYPHDIIIGGDQLVSFQGQIYGKSHSFEKACEHLQMMQGKTQELITSIYVISPQKNYLHTEITKITLKKLSREQIENYVQLDQAWDAAGSIKIEKHGLSLVEKIVTQDFTSITGLPLLTLGKILTELKVPCLQTQE